MLRFLTREALDKKGKAGQVILRQAVGIRNVELTDMLVKKGYPLSLLEPEISESSFLDVPEDQPMKAYLKSQGFQFSKR